MPDWLKKKHDTLADCRWFRRWHGGKWERWRVVSGRLGTFSVWLGPMHPTECSGCGARMPGLDGLEETEQW
jgi:hypothetical protein